MMSITISFHEYGAIVAIEVPKDKINTNYPLGTDNAIALYEYIANMLDLSNPIVNIPPTPKKNKRGKK